LGAIARRYNVASTARLHRCRGRLRRLIAEWWLKSKRVEILLRTGKNRRSLSNRASKYRRDLRLESRPETRGKARVQNRIANSFYDPFRVALRYWVISATQATGIQLGHWMKWSVHQVGGGLTPALCGEFLAISSKTKTENETITLRNSHAARPRTETSFGRPSHVLLVTVHSEGATAGAKKSSARIPTTANGSRAHGQR
jgi:hypothetical protein